MRGDEIHIHEYGGKGRRRRRKIFLFFGRKKDEGCVLCEKKRRRKRMWETSISIRVIRELFLTKTMFSTYILNEAQRNRQVKIKP